MQPRFMVAILVKPERLVRRPRYVGFFGDFTPNIILAEPQQITILIGHFARDADLVAMEIVGLLSVFAFFGCPIADLRQRFVGIWVGVDIGISAVRVDFLQEVAARPKRSGFGFRGRLKAGRHLFWGRAARPAAPSVWRRGRHHRRIRAARPARCRRCSGSRSAYGRSRFRQSGGRGRRRQSGSAHRFHW